MREAGKSALFCDLYELTMLQAYFEEGLTDRSTFSLFVRKLPPGRNFLVACGLEEVLGYLENLRFERDELSFLASLGKLTPRFIDQLAEFRFTGSVRAVPEGTPLFPHEPFLEITAPLPEAQLVETYVLNQMHLGAVLASKVARVVSSARGRPVVDFGSRRAHGTDAALKLARCGFIVGMASTSNVLAAARFGIPAVGTMAHSYIQAHDDERDAFVAFARRYPDSILLVDTYDTFAAVERIIALSRRLGADFRVRGVRLDSGDLLDLSRHTRGMLDAGGLGHLEIFASGGLDEIEIDRLLSSGAPIDGFGVGTQMVVSADAPALDMAYKLVSYGGRPRTKRSPGKRILPGAKQVFRDSTRGKDTLALAGEVLPGRPLLQTVMANGRRLRQAPTLAETREQYLHAMEGLPSALRRLSPLSYEVVLSPDLERLAART